MPGKRSTGRVDRVPFAFDSEYSLGSSFEIGTGVGVGATFRPDWAAIEITLRDVRSAKQKMRYIGYKKTSDYMDAKTYNFDA